MTSPSALNQPRPPTPKDWRQIADALGDALHCLGMLEGSGSWETTRRDRWLSRLEQSLAKALGTVHELQAPRSNTSRVLRALYDHEGEVTPFQLATAMGLPPHKVHDALRVLRRNGLVVPGRQCKGSVLQLTDLGRDGVAEGYRLTKDERRTD